VDIILTATTIQICVVNSKQNPCVAWWLCAWTLWFNFVVKLEYLQAVHGSSQIRQVFLNECCASIWCTSWVEKWRMYVPAARTPWAECPDHPVVSLFSKYIHCQPSYLYLKNYIITNLSEGNILIINSLFSLHYFEITWCRCLLIDLFYGNVSLCNESLKGQEGHWNYPTHTMLLSEENIAAYSELWWLARDTCKVSLN